LRKSITIFVGFIHDFAAGCWAATFLAIYRINDLQSKSPELAQALSPLEKEFFYIGLVCVGIVLITGMGRTFTYIENVYGKDAEKIRKKMLIVKHILLFGIFGTGTYLQYMMAFN
jgi:putative copper export protein